MPTKLPIISYLVVADSAIRDEADKKVSLIGIFNQVRVPKDKDFVYTSFSIVGRIIKVPIGKSKLQIIISTPDDKEFFKIPVETDIKDGDLQLLIKVPLAKFTKLGRYHLRVLRNGKSLKDDDKFYFEVVKQS